MNTATIFLLIVFGATTSESARNTAVLERFSTEQECRRVQQAIQDSAARARRAASHSDQVGNMPLMDCIRAEVARL